MDEIKDDQYVHAGVLRIIPGENIIIEQIQGKLLLKTKGKMASQSEPIDDFEVSPQQQQLIKNEIYEFPFKFIQKSDAGTYKGKNVHVFFELEFLIQLEKESFKRLDKNILKSLKSFVTGSTNYKYSKNIIIRKPPKYDVPESNDDLILEGDIHIIAALFSVFFIIFWLVLFNATKELHQLDIWNVLMIGIMICIALGYYVKRIFLTSILGKFNADIQKKDDKSFVSIIHSTGNWRYVQSAKTYYEVIEEVIDNRGTTSYTYTEKLYISDNLPISMRSSGEEVLHQFPRPNSVPPIIQMNNVSIKWMIVLDIEIFMSINLTYKRVIYPADGIASNPSVWQLRNLFIRD